VNRPAVGTDRARAIVRAVAVIVSLAPSGAVYGQSVPAASPPPSLEIVVVGRGDAYARLRDLLDRRLSSMGSTTWSRADRVDADDVLGVHPGHALRCWIDLGDRRRARLTFAARSGERFLVRDFELSGDLDEIDRVALAEVIELSVQALIEDERAGLSRRETQALLARRVAGAPPPQPPALPAPPGTPSTPVDAAAPTRRGPRFELGVFYAAQAVAGGLPIDNGPGLSLALSDTTRRYASGRRLVTAGWMSARAVLPESVTGADASVGLVGAAARLGIELGLQRLRLRLGAGWDVLHLSPKPTSAALALAGSRWTSTFACQAALRVEITDVRSAHFWISLLGDAIPTAVDYGVDSGGRFDVVFSPWRVRPGLALEIIFP
jgi:hypothetical protein